ncbi:hypothetical protein ACJRW5_03545 [Pseudomonas sp. SH1-B]
MKALCYCLMLVVALLGAVTGAQYARLAGDDGVGRIVSLQEKNARAIVFVQSAERALCCGLVNSYPRYIDAANTAVVYMDALVFWSLSVVISRPYRPPKND